MRTRVAACITTALLAIAAPAVALACPSCFATASPQVLRTYHFTALMMTLLPLLLLGAIAGWIYRRARSAPPDSA